MFSLSPHFLIAFLSIIAVANAGCSNGPNDDGNKPCEQNGGNCTTAVLAALGGDVRGAADLLFYGKYCGGLNKCYSNQEDFETKGKGNLGLGKRGLPPCDGVDTTCKEHDACLDRKVQLFPGGFGQVPDEDRCECDVKFVADLFDVYDFGNPTGLCDEEFYAPATGAINLVGHEAGLIAAAYCCRLKEKCDDESSGQSNELYEAANAFCDILLSGLSQVGINLCGGGE